MAGAEPRGTCEGVRELIHEHTEILFGYENRPESGDEGPDVDRKAAVRALTERLTGVRVTENLLADAGYQTGEVPEGPAGAW
ncbi:DUF6461 domain-containing protein [Streptomyces sp. NPDC001502]|uniref:DUF6461 domain-containing protein n=1 Tax=Streptomyces sp. NPDC001502 TaxID=3364578 RepID=UPI0036B39754